MKRVYKFGGLQIVLLRRSNTPARRVGRSEDGHTWVWLHRVLLTDCTCYDLAELDA